MTVVRKWGEKDRSGVQSFVFLPAEQQADFDLCPASQRLPLNPDTILFPLQNYRDILTRTDVLQDTSLVSFNPAHTFINSHS